MLETLTSSSFHNKTFLSLSKKKILCIKKPWSGAFNVATLPWCNLMICCRAQVSSSRPCEIQVVDVPNFFSSRLFPVVVRNRVLVELKILRQKQNFFHCEKFYFLQFHQIFFCFCAQHFFANKKKNGFSSTCSSFSSSSSILKERQQPRTILWWKGKGKGRSLLKYFGSKGYACNAHFLKIKKTPCLPFFWNC